MAGVAAVSLALNGAVAALAGIPRPAVHDEFSYLLAADTFAHGRLTNPPHPLWPHFESIHIIQQPSYQSKYPPGQGLALAAGQVLTRQPIAGVWLSTALAAAAVGWMLLARVPLPWAALGGLLAAMHPLVLRWSQSYFGGALAVLGGALLVGGAERIVRRAGPGAGLAAGAGIALLAATRPYEGFVLTLLVLTRLAWSMRRAAESRRAALRAGLLMAAVVAPALAGLAYYNQRVTGDALTPPYVVHARQYLSAALFVWQRPGPPKAYRHEAMRAFHLGWELSSSRGQGTPPGFAKASARKLGALAARYTLKGALAVLLIGLVRVARADRAVAGDLLVLVLFTAALLLPRWTFPHYAAPAFGLFILLLATGARALWSWRWRAWPAGRALVLAVALLHAGAIARAAVIEVRRPPGVWTAERARVVAAVRAAAPRSLVIVRYGPRKDVHVEWVYNDADIDASPIVWARAMTPGEDRALLDYYRDRKVWTLTVDWHRAVLTPGPPGPV
jgi:hypothetical protein